MKSFLLTAAGCLLFAAPAMALTEAECTTMWTQADANNDGTLSGEETTRYAAWMRINGQNVAADGTISKAAFLENCKTDVFKSAAVDEGAPLEGANSFTEGQAQDRVIASGLADVSALTKDDKGIWRGTAKKSGQSVQVAVDYKGNVVTN